jgi:threonine dehydrogenase-like Zn-dependent dehydrogenase
LSPKKWAVYGTVREAKRTIGKDGIDILVDASGYFDDSLLPLVAPGGHVLLVALRSHKKTVDFGALADRSVSLVGSIDSVGTFDDAQGLLASGQIPTKNLISHVVSMEEVPASLSLLGCDVRNKTYLPSAAALKIIVRVGAG